MGDAVKIRYWIRMDTCESTLGDTVEVDKDIWDEMGEVERYGFMREYAFDHVEWDYKELDD